MDGLVGQGRERCRFFPVAVNVLASGVNVAESRWAYSWVGYDSWRLCLDDSLYELDATQTNTNGVVVHIS